MPGGFGEHERACARTLARMLSLAGLASPQGKQALMVPDVQTAKQYFLDAVEVAARSRSMCMSLVRLLEQPSRCAKRWGAVARRARTAP